MNSKKTKWLAALFVLLFVLAGFARDSFFKSINLRLSYLYHQLPGYELSGPLAAANNLDYTRLYYFKFLLTAFFIVLFYLLTWFCLRYLFPASGKAKWVKFIYIGLGALSVIIYLTGILLGLREDFYAFSRFIAGILQSPIIAMMLIPAAILGKRKES